MKLYIYKQEQKRISDIFKMFQKYNFKLYLMPDGIEFKNTNSNGKINKELFVDWQVEGSKGLKLPQDCNKWIKNWKQIDAKNGRRELVEISI